MPRLDYKRCRQCGRFSKDVGPLSRHRRCRSCAIANLESNVLQMKARNGPNFTRWRQQMAASVGAVLRDDGRSTP